MSELSDNEKEGVEKGLDAKWKQVKPPYLGARNSSSPPPRPAIVFNGVQYGDELPERLKEEGVQVVNTREEVQDNE